VVNKFIAGVWKRAKVTVFYGRYIPGSSGQEGHDRMPWGIGSLTAIPAIYGEIKACRLRQDSLLFIGVKHVDQG
jgi:hypothetical protein